MYLEIYLLLTFVTIFYIIQFNKNIFLTYIPIIFTIMNLQNSYYKQINFTIFIFNLNNNLSLTYILIFLILLPITIFYAEFYNKNYFNKNMDKTEKYIILFSIMNGIFLSISYNYITIFIFYELLSILSLFLMNYNKILINATKDYIRYVIIPGLILFLFIILNYEESIIPFNQLILSKYTIIFFIIFSTKAALAPFSIWILSAMKAPHYISALFHSSLIVKSGLLLILRIMTNFTYPYSIKKLTIINIFLESHIVLIPTITIITMSLLAIISTDYKKILALSTIIHIAQMILSYTNKTLIQYIYIHSLSKFTLFAYLGYMSIKNKTDNELHSLQLNMYEKIFKYISVLSCLFLSGHLILGGLIFKQQALSFLNNNLYYLICLMSFIYNNKLIRGIMHTQAEMIYTISLMIFIYYQLYTYAILFLISYTIPEYLNYKAIAIIIFCIMILTEIY